MSRGSIDHGTNRGGGPPDPPDPAAEMAAEIVVAEDAPAECTIFPRGVAGFERTTTWISAEEGSFVSLADTR